VQAQPVGLNLFVLDFSLFRIFKIATFPHLRRLAHTFPVYFFLAIWSVFLQKEKVFHKFGSKNTLKRQNNFNVLKPSLLHSAITFFASSSPVCGKVSFLRQIVTCVPALLFACFGKPVSQSTRLRLNLNMYKDGSNRVV
jgi:hypothetical protein